MAAEVDVKARLKVEEGAGSTSTLERIRRGFMGVDSAADDATGGVVEFARQSAAAAVGVNLVPAIAQVKDFAMSFVDAGAEAANADRAVAGMIMSVQGAPWEEAIDGAGELGDRLDDIAINAGHVGDDVAGAFNRIIEVVGATREGVDQAVTTTEQLTTVANVLNKSAEGLAQEFAFAREGMIKTKSQLFQLLQPTGIFGDNIKKASEYWASMTEESRAQQLAYGLEQVSSKLAQAEPTIEDYLTTIDNLLGLAKEWIGEPLAKALAPAMQETIAKLKQAAPAIEAFAETMAKDVGEWTTEAVKTAEEAFQYLRDHHQEIRDAIVEGYRTAKDVVDFILAHKEEIAIAFGVKAAAPLVGQGVGMAGKLIAANAGGISGLGLAGAGGGTIAAASTIAAFAVAVAAWTAAIDQWSSLMSETQGGMSEAEQDQDARKRYFEGMAANPSMGAMGASGIKGFEEIRAAYIATAQELGEDARAAGQLADKAWAAHRAVREMVGPVEEAAKMFDIFDASLKAGMIPDEASIATSAQLVGQVAGSFTKALEVQNQGAQKYIADLMIKSEGLRNAFLAGADLTAEGFEALAKLVEGGSKDFADMLRGRAAEKGGGTATPAAPKVVMTGGQTFKIQQDFRDQDPDRVALVFERDIGRLVERKLGAGTGGAFGA